MGCHILIWKEEREDNTFWAEGAQDDEWSPSSGEKGPRDE